MRMTLACWRLLRCAAHLLHGALICSFAFPFLKPARRLQLVGWWCARLLDLLGIELRVSGTPRRRATLVVANHISWLDILAINAVQPVRFVSKADVRRWPLLGWLVACGGGLFIQRERERAALRAVHHGGHALPAP